MRFTMGLILGAAVIFASMPVVTFDSSGAPGDGIIINEVYYDPDGPEIENEWVELWNSVIQSPELDSF